MLNGTKGFMELQDLKNIPFEIKLTAAAATQIKLMLRNDFTLINKSLRLAVKGKGCDGFTYAIQFSELSTGDVEVKLNDQIKLIMDDFTAQFAKSGTLDFIQSHHEEGFVFLNDNEKLFHGKFYKELNLEL